jgi:hypothetical protein
MLLLLVLLKDSQQIAQMFAIAFFSLAKEESLGHFHFFPNVFQFLNVECFEARPLYIGKMVFIHFPIIMGVLANLWEKH